MRILTPAEYAIEERLREKLATFPLYKPSDWLSALIKDGSTYIGYGPTPSRSINEGKTMFDLTIKGGVLDIIQFFIQRGRTRQGLGTNLYNRIEEFAWESGIRRIVTSPSGQGNNFWPKMGFKQPVEGKLIEKLL
jgi:GNAT superfamily N-acetyltransferase